MSANAHIVMSIFRKFLAIRLLLLSSLACIQCNAETKEAYPVEVGPIKWERDFDKATERAAKEDKPIFAFFQEVPG